MIPRRSHCQKPPSCTRQPFKLSDTSGSSIGATRKAHGLWESNHGSMGLDCREICEKVSSKLSAHPSHHWNGQMPLYFPIYWAIPFVLLEIIPNGSGLITILHSSTHFFQCSQHSTKSRCRLEGRQRLTMRKDSPSRASSECWAAFSAFVLTWISWLWRALALTRLHQFDADLCGGTTICFVFEAKEWLS